MTDVNMTVEQGFYQRCAELLGCDKHVYRKFPYYKRTRWNNRGAGNGRYEGFGLIRLFGSKVHMALHSPVRLNRWFNSQDEALLFLANLS
jgi:hypothetical protein